MRRRLASSRPRPLTRWCTSSRWTRSSAWPAAGSGAEARRPRGAARTAPGPGSPWSPRGTTTRSTRSRSTRRARSSRRARWSRTSGSGTRARGARRASWRATVTWSAPCSWTRTPGSSSPHLRTAPSSSGTLASSGASAPGSRTATRRGRSAWTPTGAWSTRAGGTARWWPRPSRRGAPPSCAPGSHPSSSLLCPRAAARCGQRRRNRTCAAGRWTASRPRSRAPATRLWCARTSGGPGPRPKCSEGPRSPTQPSRSRCPEAGPGPWTAGRAPPQCPRSRAARTGWSRARAPRPRPRAGTATRRALARSRARPWPRLTASWPSRPTRCLPTSGAS
mmetsp:Transcript_13393/g.45397  ORF Transcript_13393/g.45397 Transcript_13393/m.45397 type:complete len:335 (-) Transcript_13393:1252-2256(-)